jgi:VanZ family protein
MLVASLDEYHHSFNPERTGTVRDVILDTCAGITVQLLLFLWFTLRKSRASRS